jgi:hypothetical protein
MPRESDWSFVQLDRVNKIIFIQDNDGPVSVTNNAEQVCKEVILHTFILDVSEYRLVYRDTDGKWDELIHEQGRFKDFAPWNRLVPYN